MCNTIKKITVLIEREREREREPVCICVSEPAGSKNARGMLERARWRVVKL